MGFLDFLFGKKAVPEPEDFGPEIEGLSGSETFLKALEAAKFDEYKPLSDRPRAWFAASLELFRADPPAAADKIRIADALVSHAAESYRYVARFDEWFEDVLKSLPADLREATLDSAEGRLTGDHDDSVYLELIKFMGGERSAKFFADRRQLRIDEARSKHTHSWAALLAKCSHLEIVSLKAAGDFLKDVAGVKAVARYGTDTLSWHLDTARHMSNVEDVVCYGVGCTAANNGRFSQLADNAEARRSPIPHLVAGHSWSQAQDAYGTDTLYVLRVADNEYVCYDKENYG